MGFRKNKSLLQQAGETVASVAAEVAENVQHTVADVVDVVEDRVGEVVEAAREAVTDEPSATKRGGGLRKVLLVGALVAVGGVVFAKLRAKKAQSTNWESSYVPKAPAASATPTKVSEVKDAAKETAQKAAEDAKQTAEKAAESAKDTANGMKDPAKDS